MATVVPPNPVFPQNPVVPVAGVHTTSLSGNQLAQSVNTTLAQTTAYLAQSATTTLLVPGTDRNFSTIYQNTKPNPIWVRVIGTTTTGATMSGFNGSVNPPTQLADQTSNPGVSTGAASSILFPVYPNDFYEVTTDHFTMIAWNEIDF